MRMPNPRAIRASRTPTRIIAATLAAGLAASVMALGTANAAPKPMPRAGVVSQGQLPSGTTIPAGMFGMHVAFAEDGQWPSIPVGSLRIWDNKASWANIEQQQGQFNWTALDNTVHTAQQHGVNDILYVLAGTPMWATSDPSPAALPQAGAAGMPRDLAYWDAWVTAVVSRYKGRITAYQPWNEANLATFFTGTAEQMAELTKRAYDIIKRIDPAATVVAPSTGTRLGGPFKSFYPKFLKQLEARGWPVDVWAAHTYPASLGKTADRFGLAKAWIDLLKQNGAPAKPLWDTENNFGLKGPGPLNPDVDIEGQQAADWVGETYLDAIRLGISRVYWYRWEPYNDLWGIQMYNGTPGAKAFQAVESWIVGATFQKCTSKAGAVTCKFVGKDGKPFRVVYSDTDKAKAFKRNGASQQCTLLDGCKPATAKIRTAGPVKLV